MSFCGGCHAALLVLIASCGALLGSFRNTFGKYSVASAPHVYLIPMGKTVPTTSYALNQLEITKGLVKPGGDMEEFSRDIAKATGIEASFI